MLIAILTTAIALFATALFVQSGLGKMRQASAYADSFAAYLGRSVPLSWVRAMGFLELLTGVLTALPVTRTVGALGCVLLLWLYGAMMSVQIAAGRRDLRCGCGGPASDTRIGPELVLRNLVVSIPLLALVFTPLTMANLVQWLTGLALGTMLILAYASAEQVIANRQKLGRTV